MNDFLRRLTILSLIPRQPDWDGPYPARPSPSMIGSKPRYRDNTATPQTRRRSGRISAPMLLEALQDMGFQGNIRAVQRDLVFLAKLFPCLQNDGARSGGQGWSWRRDAEVMDMPALDPAMALTFVMARDVLTPLLPPLLLQRLDPYFSTAEQVLANAGVPGLASWKDRIRVVPEGQPLRHAHIDPEVMAVIQAALLDGKRFKGRYQPRDRDLAEYEFNPLGLVFRQRVVYLVATLWDYADPRQFAVHRFKQATPMGLEATGPDGFNLDAYIATGGFEYPSADAVTETASIVKLRMSMGAASHLHETPLSKDQIISEDPQDPDWVRVTATLKETEQLYWWLLGFGAQVEVLEPVHLRERMVSNIQALLVRYGLNQDNNV